MCLRACVNRPSFGILFSKNLPFLLKKETDELDKALKSCCKCSTWHLNLAHPSNNHLSKLMKVRYLKTGNGNTFGWQECWKLTRFQSFSDKKTKKKQGIRFASCNHHALFVNQMIKARRSFFFSCRRQFSWPYGWSGFDSVKLVWRNEEKTLVICCWIQKFLKNAFQSGAVHSWLDLTATYYICLFSSVIPCCLPPSSRHGRRFL